MKLATTRMETFSDGVIAIIITIMVIQFKLPQFKETTSSWRIMQYLSQNLPYLLAYVFSFILIGIFWTNHHHMFHLLERTDTPLLWQNLFFLFWLSLIPLATAIIGASPSVSESVALYGFIMFMSSLAFAVMRSYSIRKKLVHREDDRALNQQIKTVTLKSKTKSYVGVACYALSVGLAFVNVWLAYTLFLVPPILFFVPESIDDENLAERLIKKNG